MGGYTKRRLLQVGSQRYPVEALRLPILLHQVVRDEPEQAHSLTITLTDGCISKAIRSISHKTHNPCRESR